MADGTPQDAFYRVGTDPKTDSVDPWGTFEHLLSQKRNLKGCARVDVQRHHGRDGMRSFMARNMCDKDGEPVGRIAQVAHVPDPEALARELYQVILADARRCGCDTYRVQLFIADGKIKDGTLPTKKGEHAGIRLNPVSGEVLWNASGELTPEEKWKEIANWCAGELKALQSNTGELMNQALTMMTGAVGVTDELEKRRLEHSKMMRDAELPASPEVINERLKIGLESLNATVRQAVGWYFWNKDGKIPPFMQDAPKGNGQESQKDVDADDAKLQNELRLFWGKLTSGQHEKLKEIFGTANHQGLSEVLDAELHVFQANFAMLGGLLMRTIHSGALTEVLTDEQMAELRRMFPG